MAFTVVLIKSDAIENKNFGWIRQVIRKVGTTEWSSSLFMSSTFIKDFYAEHIDKPYYYELEDSVSRIVWAGVLVGDDDIIAKWRSTMVDGYRSIRSTYRELQCQVSSADNAVHGSDSVESAIRELKVINKHCFIAWHLSNYSSIDNFIDVHTKPSTT